VGSFENAPISIHFGQSFTRDELDAFNEIISLPHTSCGAASQLRCTPEGGYKWFSCLLQIRVLAQAHQKPCGLRQAGLSRG
jgi:hypothetical protein